jgi:hypothetical protein
MSKWLNISGNNNNNNGSSHHRRTSLFGSGGGGGGKKDTEDNDDVAVAVPKDTPVGMVSSITSTSSANYNAPTLKLVDAVQEKSRESSRKYDQRDDHCENGRPSHEPPPPSAMVEKIIAEGSIPTPKNDNTTAATHQSASVLPTSVDPMVAASRQSRGRSKSPRNLQPKGRYESRSQSPSLHAAKCATPRNNNNSNAKTKMDAAAVSTPRQRGQSPRNLQKVSNASKPNPTNVTASDSLYSAQNSTKASFWDHFVSSPFSLFHNGDKDDPKSKGLLPEQNHQRSSASIRPTQSYRTKMEKAMEAAIKSYDDDTIVANKQIARAGLSANDLAAGQLMRWKTEAEEGPCLIQSLAFFLALVAIVCTLYPVIMIQEYWNVSTWIVAFHTVNLCGMILIFELRSLGVSLGPLNARSKIRAIASRYLNILRLLWGRGLLYTFAGSMTAAVGWPVAVCVGAALSVVGAMAIFTGARASFNLDRLKSSVTDEVYLWTKFDAVDDDGDEMIGVDGFSSLVWYVVETDAASYQSTQTEMLAHSHCILSYCRISSRSLGLEIKDTYTYQTFVTIDTDKNGLISFEDFKGWWFEGQEKNKNGGFVKRIIV